MKTDFENGERLFAEDLNDNFVETDNRLTAAETDIDNLQSATAGAAYVPSGAVFWFAADSAPSGYLECDGSLVSRSTYATLFGVVGTTFGAGDGSTTFKLPDLRGEFIRGWDDGRGVDSGRAFGSAQASQNLAHTHTLTLNRNGDGTIGFAGRNATPETGTTSSSGGSEARPRNVALLACIKT